MSTGGAMAGAGSSIMAGKAFVALGLKDSGFRRGMGMATGMMEKFGRSLSSVGSAMRSIGVGSAGGLTALIGGLGLATKTLASFDDSMRLVDAVTGNAEGELEKYTATARRLGEETSFTASQIGVMMESLGRKGMEKDSLRNATAQILNLARAAGTDLETAGQIALNVMNQMGLRSDDAATELANLTRVTNTLVGGTIKTSARLEDLGVAMSYAGAMSREFNMDVEETIAVLGVMRDMGLRAEQTGAAFRNIMTGLLGRKASARKFFKDLGIDSLEDGELRNPIDRLQELLQKISSVDKGRKLQIFDELFTIKGLQGALSFEKGLKKIVELSSEFKELDNIAADIAEKMDDGIGGSVRRMQSAFESLMITIGKEMEPLVTSVLEGARRVFNAVSKFVKENGSQLLQMITGIGSIASAGSLLIPIGGLVTAAGGAFLIAGGAIGSIATAVTTIVGATGGAAIPVFLFGGMEAVKASSKAVGDIWKSWPALFTKLKEAVGTVFQDLEKTLTKLNQLLKDGKLEESMDLIQKYIELVLGRIRIQVIDFANELGRRVGEAINDGIKSQLAKSFSLGFAGKGGYIDQLNKAWAHTEGKGGGFSLFDRDKAIADVAALQKEFDSMFMSGNRSKTFSAIEEEVIAAEKSRQGAMQHLEALYLMRDNWEAITRDSSRSDLVAAESHLRSIEAMILAAETKLGMAGSELSSNLGNRPGFMPIGVTDPISSAVRKMTEKLDSFQTLSVTGGRQLAPLLESQTTQNEYLREIAEATKATAEEMRSSDVLRVDF